jgi:metallo-beta-lactamase family protein
MWYVSGSHHHEKHNHDPFPFDVSELDAVVITHAHLDHSGRLPMLIKEGFHGSIYTHNATADLYKIMLIDSGYIHEKEAMDILDKELKHLHQANVTRASYKQNIII